MCVVALPFQNSPETVSLRCFTDYTVFDIACPGTALEERLFGMERIGAANWFELDSSLRDNV